MQNIFANIAGLTKSIGDDVVIIRHNKRSNITYRVDESNEDINIMARGILVSRDYLGRKHDTASVVVLQFESADKKDYSTNNLSKYAVCVKDMWSNNCGRVFKQTKKGWVEI